MFCSRSRSATRWMVASEAALGRLIGSTAMVGWCPVRGRGSGGALPGRSIDRDGEIVARATISRKPMVPAGVTRESATVAVMQGDHPNRSMAGPELNVLATQATVHCLTGCSIGEILGMVISTALAWHDLPLVVLSIVLAFIFG